MIPNIFLAFSLALSMPLSAAADVSPEDPVQTQADTPERAETLPGQNRFAWTPVDGDVIRFKVLRKGSPFGTHIIRFSGDAATELNVRSQVELKAGLGPITLFKYALDARETWIDGVLVELEGTGNNDGKKMRVSAQQNGETLSITGTEFTGEVPLGILPSSHWNMAQIDTSQMVSTEDGEIIPVASQKVGREEVMIEGQSILADRYLLVSAINLDLWYDDQARLVKLAFETQGQSIVYQLQNLY